MYSAILFLSPFARPISKMLIQLTVDDMASHMPYLLVSSSLREKEIVKNETMILMALSKKETVILKFTFVVRPLLSSNNLLVYVLIYFITCLSLTIVFLNKLA